MDSKLKVVTLVSYPYLPARVGGQRGIALFYKYFSREVSLTCVTVRSTENKNNQGYQILNILSDSPARYINIFYFFTVRRWLKATGASHLMIEHPYYGWLGCLLKSITGVKLVVRSHNIESLRFKSLGKWWWPILKKYEGRTHRCADYNFFIHDEDREYAMTEFNLDPAKCITLTYGIEISEMPTTADIEAASRQVHINHNLPANTKILFFNGAFKYKPNFEALKTIVEIINPILCKTNLDYRIIIAGADIPDSIASASHPNMIFAGYVDDIATYFKGSDVFINPITEGGGIKTKLVEAIGYGLNSVSTVNGAIGVPASICDGKLFTVADTDWQGFVNRIIEAGNYKAATPPEYYDHFFLGNNSKRAATFIR